MITFAPATLVHVGPIATRMREIDRAECAAFGRSAKSALRMGVASSIAITVFVDERPEAMLGLTVTSAIDGEGTPWMLGTDEVYRHGRALMAFGPSLVASMLETCPHLSNFVMRRNHKAIRLLKRWGFTVEPDAIAIGGKAFLVFHLDSSHVKARVGHAVSL